MLLSIVVPVYKEEKNIPEFLRRIRPILAGISDDYEIIFSLDPSPDLLLSELIGRGAHLVSLNPMRDTLEDFFVRQVADRPDEHAAESFR